MGRQITMVWDLNNIPEGVVARLIKDASFEIRVPVGDKYNSYEILNPRRIVIESKPTKKIGE